MKKMAAVIASVSLAAMIFCACTGLTNEKHATVAVEGSTSMERLIGFLGEAYSNENANVKVTYNPTGSSSGIKAVEEGSCDIGLSSRELTDEEKRTLEETVVAIDAIAIIVNSENTVDGLTSEEAAAVFSGKITNWKTVNGKDAPIVLIGREEASGTRDGFESVTGTVGACKYSQELTSSGDVFGAVTSNPYAIGYASEASVKKGVKILKIDGVFPDNDKIQDGSYGITRNFIFVTRKDKELSKEAEAFFRYVKNGDADEFIKRAGAVPLARQ